MAVTTKIYKNTGKEKVFVVSIGDIPAGEQVSITTEYHQPVVLANYPTIVEVTALDYVEDETPAIVQMKTEKINSEEPQL